MIKDAANPFELVRNNSIAELESILTGNPATADTINEQGVSLLLMAAYYRNKEAVAVINKFKKGLSAWEAACIGDTAQLRAQLNDNPSLIHSVSPDGFSLLSYACFFEQENIAEFLVKEGANLNAPSQNAMKVTPLHSAAAVSNYALCKLLLENGTNVNAIQQGGYTALHAAAQNGNTELAKLFLVYGAEKNLLTEKGESAADIARANMHEETASLLDGF